MREEAALGLEIFLQDYSLENEAIRPQSSCMPQTEEVGEELRVTKDVSPALHAETTLKISSTQSVEGSIQQM